MSVSTVTFYLSRRGKYVIQNEFVQTIKPSVKHPVSHLSELYLKADNYKLVSGQTAWKNLNGLI